MNIKLLCLVSGGLLLVGIPTGLPYDFYIFLRWAIAISSVIVAYNFYEAKLTVWTFIFGAVAILFNPIAPFYLDKSTWVFFDFIGAVLFFVAAYSNKNK